MKYTAAIIAASAAVTRATSCAEEGGNYYCDAVSAIQYTGLDLPGSYKAVSSMDSSGTCSYASQSYSGAIAPFDEEVRQHFESSLMKIWTDIPSSFRFTSVVLPT
jgi:hypothetical protein